ncbi:prefoldin subunit 5 [Neocloeon triangulifer]|uniref:prefoldin subunit 5 n=1 Tax=Neocloeon triangulifer TaxID=2078957 RepID=UPI00286EDEB1|nr:prefoldin subunit 5 [Neocloeon triangulifer]
MTSNDVPAAVQEIEIGPHMGLPQLNTIKNSLEQELAVMQDSLQTLKVAQQKFQQSADCMERVDPNSEGKEILVPLTGSMYVSGKVLDSNNALINIGTGYYIEKDIEGAKDYFDRKVKFVTEQMEKIQSIGIEKSKIRDSIADMMQAMMAQMQKQVGTASSQTQTS